MSKKVFGPKSSRQEEARSSLSCRIPREALGNTPHSSKPERRRGLVSVLQFPITLTPEQKQECARYDALLAALRRRRLTRQEIDFLDFHEDHCPGPHSARAHEAALGLPLGALDPNTLSHHKEESAEPPRRQHG